MAQFSMEIMRLTGSVLRGNQHFGVHIEKRGAGHEYLRYFQNNHSLN